MKKKGFRENVSVLHKNSYLAFLRLLEIGKCSFDTLQFCLTEGSMNIEGFVIQRLFSKKERN